jgi:hypothetical protein
MRVLRGPVDLKELELGIKNHPLLTKIIGIINNSRTIMTNHLPTGKLFKEALAAHKLGAVDTSKLHSHHILEGGHVNVFVPTIFNVKNNFLVIGSRSADREALHFVWQLGIGNSVQHVRTPALHLQDIFANPDCSTGDIRIVITNCGTNVRIEPQTIAKSGCMKHDKIALAMVVIPNASPCLEMRVQAAQGFCTNIACILE